MMTRDLHFLEMIKNMIKGDLVNEVSKVVKTKKNAQAAVDCVLFAFLRYNSRDQNMRFIWH